VSEECGSVSEECGSVSEECGRVRKIIRIGLGFNLCVAPLYCTTVLFRTERELGKTEVDIQTEVLQQFY
jgi:hypothetical protein